MQRIYEWADVGVKEEFENLLTKLKAQLNSQGKIKKFQSILFIEK